MRLDKYLKVSRPITIAASKSIVFKPGKALKDTL